MSLSFELATSYFILLPSRLLMVIRQAHSILVLNDVEFGSDPNRDLGFDL